jgi:hypothetical protein
MTFSSPLGSVISVSSSSNSPSGRQESLAFIRFDQLHLPPFRLFDTDIRAHLHDVAIIPERDAVPESVAVAPGGLLKPNVVSLSGSDQVPVGNHQRTAFVHALNGKLSGQFCHSSRHAS